MNCNAFIEKLDDLLDGELPPSESRELEAHAANCPSCNTALTAARRLQRQAFTLPAEREPGRDLWPEIAKRLEPRASVSRQGRWTRALAAGVAAVAIFAGGMLASHVLQRQPAPTLQAERSHGALPSAEEARRILPASYVELVSAADAGSNTEQALLRNLLVVNLAIREVEEALADDPANADLRELLSGLYAQENRILAQAERMRVARPATTRTAI